MTPVRDMAGAPEHLKPSRERNAPESGQVARSGEPEPTRLSRDTNASAAPVMSVTALDTADKPRHRWYFFKEGFSPDVVDRALEDAKCGPDDIIIDPFCGSGTVPLQAALMGHPAMGTEVNPFLAFVARAKLVDCRSETFAACAKSVLEPARRGCRSRLTDFSTFSDGTRQRDDQKRGKWLFNRSVLEAFEGAWRAVGVSNTPAQQLVKLCLLGAATDAGNVTKDGKALRYRTDWRERDFDATDFLVAFEARVADVVEDLRTTPLDPNLARVRLGDARNRAATKEFRLCITSPPYLNSFDYTDVYRPALFLGGWVRDMRELRALRLKTLRSHVQVEWDDPIEDNFGTHYADVIARIRPLKAELWSGRIPLMVQAYFEDMQRVLKRLRSKAADDASVWIVISTSAYGGIEIPVDLIIADIASSCGWFLRDVKVLRHLGRVAGQQWTELAKRSTRNLPHLRESLIILDAKPAASRKHQ